MAGIKFKARLKAMDFRRSQYQAVLLNHLRSLNERAGQAWLRVVTEETPIPTWSGASRATFQKLARDLGTSVPIGPIRAKKNRVSLGLANAGQSGTFEDGLSVGFIYETTLRYLAYNEYNAAVAGPPPQPYSNNVRFTPYNFQDRARPVWEAMVKKAKMPNITKYITMRKI